MKKNKNRITTVLLALVFLAGLSLLLYPTVSDYWNSFHASRAVAAYAQEVADLNGAEYDRLLEAVRPEYAVLSVGYNSYGHPAPEALARLEAAGCDIYRTDWSGTVRFMVN